MAKKTLISRVESKIIVTFLLFNHKKFLVSNHENFLVFNHENFVVFNHEKCSTTRISWCSTMRIPGRRGLNKKLARRVVAKKEIGAACGGFDQKLPWRVVASTKNCRSVWWLQQKNGVKMVSRWCRDGVKMASRWCQDGVEAVARRLSAKIVSPLTVIGSIFDVFHRG